MGFKSRPQFGKENKNRRGVEACGWQEIFVSTCIPEYAFIQMGTGVGTGVVGTEMITSDQPRCYQVGGGVKSQIKNLILKHNVGGL